MRGKDEIRDLQIEVVTGIDVQVLWLEIAMCEAFVLDGLKPVNQLLEVVARDWLRQATRLRKHHEKIRLVGREHKVGVHVAPEFNHSRVEALNNVWMVNDVEDLLLVLGLIYFCLLLLVQFDEHFNLLHLLLLLLFIYSFRFSHCDMLLLSLFHFKICIAFAKIN